jgi:AmmeMemoRadiSam system protein B
VLPIAVGKSTVDDVAAVIAAAVAVQPAGTVVLCSTDLSHYLPDASAREQDKRTIEAVLALAPDRVGPGDACGVFALRGLLGWARGAGLRPELLAYGTSADTSGDPSRVVGYPAVMMCT